MKKQTFFLLTPWLTGALLIVLLLVFFRPAPRVQASGIAPTAYSLIKNAGSSLTQRSVLNFTAGGCSDNSGTSPPETDCTGGGGTGSAGATLFSTINSTTVTQTSATSLIGSVTGSTTVPANTFTAGQVLEVAGQGFYSTPASADSLTFQLLIGGSSRISTGAVVQTASVTNGTWQFRCLVTTRTTGSSGTQIADCTILQTAATIAADASPLHATSAWTIDTTATQAIDLQANWSTATGSPTITSSSVAAWIPGAPVSSVNGQTGAVTVTPFITPLTAPVAASFTQQNYNTGSGVTTTQTNNTSPVTSISILQHDPNGTTNIAAIDKAEIAATFTLSECFSIAPSGTEGFIGLYLSDGGSPPHIIIYGMETGQSPVAPTALIATIFSSFTNNTGNVFTINPPQVMGPLMCLRVQETVSNRIYSGSSDGIAYAQIVSEAVGAHFTTARYGFAVEGRVGSSSTPDTLGTLYSFKETNP